MPAHRSGHALGMGHEQKRPDRDEYVDVHWDKMWDPKDKIDWTDQYLKDPKADMSRPYDYNSLMQCMPKHPRA